MTTLWIIAIVFVAVIGTILFKRDRDELEPEAGEKEMDFLSRRLNSLYTELDHVPGKNLSRAEAVVYEIKATELRIADTLQEVR